MTDINCGPASPPGAGSTPSRPSKTASQGAQADHARSPLQFTGAGPTLTICEGWENAAVHLWVKPPNELVNRCAKCGLQITLLENYRAFNPITAYMDAVKVRLGLIAEEAIAANSTALVGG